MNHYQQDLFNNLESLTASSEVFFSKDITHTSHLGNVHRYRVYDYRLANYTDFTKPSARECRGIMFRMDEKGDPVWLACHMPPKFFNLGENPFTIGLDLSDSNIDAIMDKRDGSIISTFMEDADMVLKSKTSLTSEHAAQATEYLKHPSRAQLHSALRFISGQGYAVHMELTSPSLRIVLGYPEINLTILSIRNNRNGEWLLKSQLEDEFEQFPTVISTLREHWVEEFNPTEMMRLFPEHDPLFEGVTSTEDFLSRVKDQKGVEGYVVRLKNGECIKIKCDWYCALHLSKDSISAPRRLFECVIQQATDDLKAMFVEDELTLGRIKAMEDLVAPTFNHIIATAEKFYEDHKHLDRKSYALAATAIPDGMMSLKMNLYLGKTNNYKEFAIKHMDMFNIHTLNDVPAEE